MKHKKMPAAKAEIGSETVFNNINETVQGIIREPTVFLNEQPKLCPNILKAIHQIYKLTIQKDVENRKNAEVLPELVLEDMDQEQIWQQLELRNNVVLPQLLTGTAKLLALNEHKYEVRLKGEEEEEEASEAEEDDLADDEDAELADLATDEEAENADDMEQEGEDDESDDDEEEELFPTKQTKRRGKPSIVDDKFFKLDEMEAFLEAEDAKEMRKQAGKPAAHDSDGIDYFREDVGEDEDESNDEITYKNFFDDDEQQPKEHKTAKRKPKDHFAEEDDEDEQQGESDNAAIEQQTDSEQEEQYSNDEQQLIKNASSIKLQNNTDSDDDDDDTDSDKEEKPKSSFELRQERLKQRITDYENEILGEKPWQLKGEIKAGNRPQNSLLEEVLEFEASVRPAPVITEATTRCLEDIIKQRIKDQAWDDVVPVAKPVHDPSEYRKQLVLDHEQSKQSLAQIYEQDYQRELAKLNPNQMDDSATKDEEPKAHKEIRNSMHNLFIKLDALSNFHFAPKPVAPELKIITNTPAIAMEEVAPVAVSDAMMLAPEEIFKKPRQELLGKSERSSTDKNRERRKKKQKQRAIHKALEAKDVQRQKLGIPLSQKEEKAKLLKNITKHRNVQKINTNEDKSALKSSKAFFSKLQDTTASAAALKAGNKKKAAAHTNGISAKKLKL